MKENRFFNYLMVYEKSDFTQNKYTYSNFQQTAADVYISRCDKAPFGNSKITLFKGFKNEGQQRSQI